MRAFLAFFLLQMVSDTIYRQHSTLQAVRYDELEWRRQSVCGGGGVHRKNLLPGGRARIKKIAYSLYLSNISGGICNN